MYRIFREEEREGEREREIPQDYDTNYTELIQRLH